MAEVQCSARLIGVRYICDDCEEGEMERVEGAGVQLTDPMRWPHKCNKCGHNATLTQSYPGWQVAIDPLA